MRRVAIYSTPTVAAIGHLHKPMKPPGGSPLSSRGRPLHQERHRFISNAHTMIHEKEEESNQAPALGRACHPPSPSPSPPPSLSIATVFVRLNMVMKLMKHSSLFHYLYSSMFE
jgi:hypothetical protein